MYHQKDKYFISISFEEEAFSVFAKIDFTGTMNSFSMKIEEIFNAIKVATGRQQL